MILMHKFGYNMSPLTARVLVSPICHQKWAKNENIQLKLEKWVVFAHILPKIFIL